MIYSENQLNNFSEPLSKTEDEKCMHAIQEVRDALQELGFKENGLKSIFETGFKRHSEPRLPSTAQINH